MFLSLRQLEKNLRIFGAVPADARNPNLAKHTVAGLKVLVRIEGNSVFLHLPFMAERDHFVESALGITAHAFHCPKMLDAKQYAAFKRHVQQYGRRNGLIVTTGRQIHGEGEFLFVFHHPYEPVFFRPGKPMSRPN